MQKNKFKNQQELWEWLIAGNEIIEPFKAGNRIINLCDGNPVYETGESAYRCLLSHDYWLKHNAPAKLAAESGSGLGVELGGTGGHDGT